MQKEIWRDAKCINDFYEVSNFGRIRSKDRIIVYSNNSTHFHKGRVLKQMNHPAGYKFVSIRVKGISKSFFIHRVVGLTFINNIHNKPQINHKDGNKANNNLYNLEWCNPSENGIHAYKTGLSKKQIGENASQSKLKNKDVINIKYLYNKGISQGKIAKRYNINQTSVHNIVKGKTWGHIKL